MIQIFRNYPKLMYVPEAAQLSLITTDKQYYSLVLAFTDVICAGKTDGNVLDPRVLTNFAYVLRHATSLTAQNANLGSVLRSLVDRLKDTEDGAELEYQFHLLCTLSTVLDAIVDIKISGLSRVTLYGPLQERLDHLKGH